MKRNSLLEYGLEVMTQNIFSVKTTGESVHFRTQSRPYDKLGIST